jgi:hypothetical protein
VRVYQFRQPPLLRPVILPVPAKRVNVLARGWCGDMLSPPWSACSSC